MKKTIPIQKKFMRRPLISVIGEAGATKNSTPYKLAHNLGRQLVDAGYRVCGGGLGGVMCAAFQGAKESEAYREGDTMAILPTMDSRDANQYADIVIPTGLGNLRNGIVAATDATVIVGGKAGTLSEAALAWQYNRLLIALSESGGVAAQFAGKKLDDRKQRREHPALHVIADAKTPEDAILFIRDNFPACYLPSRGWS